MSNPQTPEECSFHFVHRSRYACSQCRQDQVRFIKDKCSKEGRREVQIVPKEGTQCVIFPEELVKIDGKPVETYIADGIGQYAAFFYDSPSH